MSSQSAVYAPAASSSAPHPYIYSREALLALAPPSHMHGAESSSSSPTHASFSAVSPSTERHIGWIKLNEAMRRVLRATCPEIAMNRRMRKSLEFHHHRQHTHTEDNRPSRERSPQGRSRSRSTSPAITSEEHATAPIKLAPAPKASSLPSSTEIMKRSRAPTPRRMRPATSRTRQAQFARLHLNAATSIANASDGNWRTGGRPAISTPLRTISVA